MSRRTISTAPSKTSCSELQISSLNIVYEFSPKQMVPLYTAVSQVALTPLSSLVPTLGGVIAEALGYSTNFWLAGILGMASLVGMTVAVRNPKKDKENAGA